MTAIDLQRTTGTGATATRRPGEVRVAYGIGPDGRVLHVSEVASGLDCGCTCPGCKERLSAHKGEILAHHFAHHDPTNCSGGRESALHRFAKQVIAEHGMATLPPVVARHGDRERLLVEEKVFQPDEVTMEVGLDGMRPDLIARKEGRELLVEVAVTHFCGPGKIALIHERRMAAIEIDLRPVPHDASRDEMVEAILHSAPRAWLFNGKADDASKDLADDDARRAEAKRLREERHRQQEARRLVEAYRRPRADAVAARAASGHLSRVADADLTGVLSPDVSDGPCFAVANRLWQAAIVDHYCLSGWPEHGRRFRGADAWNLLCDSGMVRREFAGFIDEDVAAAAKALEPGFSPPYDTMVCFLGRLETLGCLYRDRHWWRPDGRRVRDATDRLRERAAARQRAGRGHMDLVLLLDDLPPGHGVDAAHWMRTWQPALGMTPEEHAMSSEWAADDLRRRLSRLRSMLNPGATVEEELLGLPLATQREARRLEHRTAEEARKRKRDEEARQREEAEHEAARARRATVAEAAIRMLGSEDGRRWLEAPLDVLGGLSVVAAEELTERQRDAALRVLHAEQDRLIATALAAAQAGEYRERLLEDARRAFVKKPALADLWMRQDNPALGHRKPNSFCVDKATYEICREALQRAAQPGRR